MGKRLQKLSSNSPYSPVLFFSFSSLRKNLVEKRKDSYGANDIQGPFCPVGDTIANDEVKNCEKPKNFMHVKVIFPSK